MAGKASFSIQDLLGLRKTPPPGEDERIEERELPSARQPVAASGEVSLERSSRPAGGKKGYKRRWQEADSVGEDDASSESEGKYSSGCMLSNCRFQSSLACM